MYFILTRLAIAVVLCKASTSEEITFKNVTVEWVSDTGGNTTVVTSNSLKNDVPSGEEMSVNINGEVPILYERSVSDIENLKSLVLSGVDLEEIKPGAFVNLPVLQILILSKNKLTELKSDTFRDLNVSTIDLSQNSITTLQPETFKNINIRHLTLSNNQIVEFPSGVFENVTLGSLHLYNTLLKTIAPKALATTSLSSLVLSENKLEEIDPEAFDMPELTSLSLDFNSIKHLRAGDSKNLPQLNTLDLVANKLEEVPEGVFNNSKITHLKLNYNKISTIASKAFEDMSKISVLHFDHNNLTQWDNNWLGGTSNPDYVMAGFNQFSEIPDEAFKNYPKLYSIDLQGNKIMKISPKAFHKLERVVNFSLRDNEIDSWGPDWLVGVSIGTIDLSGNKLKCIDGDLDDIFKNNDFVQLEDNPWDTECAEKIKDFTTRKEKAPKTRSYVPN
ncbi:hypothetical protein Zmor_015934 [Zophobas morio]|uniref:Leucine-rich repeat-containing protein 15 n=1 Tax=Zophobas morio TaxID=2755281 RepID=A0AA38MI06_9CUCU|nr:hypothetical protein Zmor_015934 [Zophobas morio]